MKDIFIPKHICAQFFKSFIQSPWICTKSVSMYKVLRYESPGLRSKTVDGYVQSPGLLKSVDVYKVRNPGMFKARFCVQSPLICLKSRLMYKVSPQCESQ